jgi:redox-sensitive bicupin YhaK (pirin superfamily)
MHEEMWDTGPNWGFKKIELFQLWVNLKTKSKNNEPLCQVLQANSVPVCTSANGASLKVLCGEVECDDVLFTGPGSQVADSPMVIAHVLIPPQQRVLLEAPAMSSALVYIRKGSMVNRSDDLSESFQKYDLLSYKDNSNSLETPMMIDLLSGDSGVEALVLLAEPLNEPVIMGGPMVESTEIGYELSRRVFNTVNEEKGYWDHQITDEDWLKHIRKLDLQGIIRSIKNI